MLNTGGVHVDDAELLKQLKTNTKKVFTEDDMGLIEKVISDEDFDSSEFKEGLITFSSVLRNNKRTTTKDYIKAVQFCSHMSTGESQMGAYVKTFPDRVAKKKCEGTVRASANIYHKTALVQGILQMAQIPMHLVFMAERHSAMTKLVDLMNNEDATHRIQMECADKILGHVKAPEESKLTIDMNVKNDSVSILEQSIEALAQKHLEMIGSGVMTAHDVIEAELSVDED